MIYQRALKKWGLLAGKIAIGSSLAIYIAQHLHLDHAISAGTITLLTLMTTKWETVRLSLFRLLTFGYTIFIAAIVFHYCSSQWIAFGVFIFFVVFLSCLLEWQATISVNYVVGGHLLVEQEFHLEFLQNEFSLVIIGISLAFLLNLFHDNQNQKKHIIKNMRQVEHKLQFIVGELAAYLSNKDMQRNVWDDICCLEKELEEYIKEAYEYQENTFHSHPEYYIKYFEMRQNQCHVLHNLHYEMKKIRKMPSQAKIIAEYMLYLTDYVVETNIPEKQIDELQHRCEQFHSEDLPQTREEFEGRALLYHILMDIEEFLKFKQRFVKELTEKQIQEYWNS